MRPKSIDIVSMYGLKMPVKYWDVVSTWNLKGASVVLGMRMFSVALTPHTPAVTKVAYNNPHHMIPLPNKNLLSVVIGWWCRQWWVTCRLPFVPHNNICQVQTKGGTQENISDLIKMSKVDRYLSSPLCCGIHVYCLLLLTLLSK